jgi:hypothetical protein
MAMGTAEIDASSKNKKKCDEDRTRRGERIPTANDNDANQKETRHKKMTHFSNYWVFYSLLLNLVPIHFLYSENPGLTS